ncbi:MAG: FitA-like ribbon-helix-helix domain-containing protein, partial [Planctomycetota bacterium]
NVPDELHQVLKARAALAGMSLSDYLRRELERVVERPTRDEVLARIAKRGRVDVSPSPAELLRQVREGR